MGATSFRIIGGRELDRALADELPKAVARNVMKRAAIDAMQPLEAAAKGFAPRDDGDLADGITTQPVKAKRARGSVRYDAASGVEVATGPTGRQEGGNPSWQENGTVDMPAHPYMRPAADSEGANVIARIRAALVVQIDKSKARIAARAAKGK